MRVPKDEWNVRQIVLDTAARDEDLTLGVVSTKLLATYIVRLEKAESKASDEASRLRYPDTSGQ